MATKVIKADKTPVNKRPVKMIALEHPNFDRKAGDKFDATKATANLLIDKKMAKKA